MRLLKLGCVAALGAMIGCGGTPAVDGGVNDAGNRGDGGPGDAGVTPGSSFDTAIPLTLGVAGLLSGVLPNTSTKQYYSVTLAAGDRVVTGTQTNAGTVTNGSVTDTVVTLWSPARIQVAQDDDGWPQLSTDSTLYFQAPTAGTYFVTVEDCNSAFPGGCAPPTGVTDFHYQVFCLHTAQASFPESFAASTQDGTTTHAQALSYRVPTGGTTGLYGFYIVDGDFRTTTDTHVFSFTPPTDTNVAANQRARAELFLQPIGTANGDGSTSNASVWVTDATGTTLLARANQSNFRDSRNATDGPLDLSVPVTPGQQYFLFVQSGAAASTPATDSYFMQHFIGSFWLGQKEQPASHNTVATAQLLTTPTGSAAGSYYVDGDISPATDVDWYEVDPPAGTKSVYLGCRAARVGSGLVGLTATLYDPTGTTQLGTLGPETATADLYSPRIAIASAPTKAYLKIVAASQDATVTGTSYLCSVNYSNM